MQYVKFGNTGMDVSRICLGMMSFGKKIWHTASWIVLAFPTLTNAVQVESKPWIDRVPNGTYEITYSVSGAIENGPVSEYLVYEPIPETLVYQDINWNTMPPQKLIAVDKNTGDKYIRLEGFNANSVPTITFSFMITFYEVKVDFGKIGKIYSYDKRSREYKFYTRKTELTEQNSRGQLKKYVDTKHPWIRGTVAMIQRETNGNYVEFAKRAHEVVSEEYEYYADDAPGIHPKNLLQSIESKRGHCGLRHRVFVTLLRAAGIPARLMNCNRPSQSPHVWAEFYLEKYGWIPVNLARKKGDFSHFGYYNEHCIILKKDQLVPIKSKSGREVMVGQSRGRWHWNRTGMSGKPKIEFTIKGKKIE